MAKLVNEPCTLVYTLLNDEVIAFDDFELIIRGLHSYQVESITPSRDNNNVHVKLNYQASITNANAKLGSLQPHIAVTKLSAFVKENEFSRLEQLRRQFGFGMPEQGDSNPVPTYRQSRKTRGRGHAGARAFAPRSAPYPCAPAAVQSTSFYAPEREDNDTYTIDGTLNEI